MSNQIIERSCARCGKNNPDFDQIVQGSHCVPWDWGLAFTESFQIVLSRILPPELFTEPTGIVCPDCQSSEEKQETLDVAMVDIEMQFE